MPPNLEIYCLSSHRDAATVDRFVTAHVDRESWRQRAGEELMVEPLVVEAEQIGDEDWEWIPVLTPEEAILVGLSTPPRAFALYLPSSQPDVDQAILCFTRDGHVVFGLSLDDEDEAPETLVTAQRLLREVVERHNGYRGLIAVELPPPRGSDDFRVAMRHERTIYASNSRQGELKSVHWDER